MAENQISGEDCPDQKIQDEDEVNVGTLDSTDRPHKRKASKSPSDELSTKRRSRASKRRSSFVAGRSMLQLPQQASAELHKQVPSGPGEERFASLLFSVLQYTLSKVREEFPDAEHYGNFEIHARDVMDKTVQKLKKDKGLEYAIQQNGLLPNPQNVFNENCVKELEEYKNQLMKEKQAWEDQLQKRISETQEAERLSQQVEPLRIHEEGLNKHQIQLLKGRSDFTQDRQEGLNLCEKAVLQLQVLSNTVELMKRLHTATNSLHLQGVAKINADSLGGVKQDAKTSITNIMSLS